MIEQNETVVEIRTVSYTMTLPDGAPISAAVSGNEVELKYEGASGYVTARLPLLAMPALVALAGSVMAAVAPAELQPTAPAEPEGGEVPD